MNSSSSKQPAGYVTFLLHSHLPYVVHHGTWPHGLDWLNEAAAETYLPLLRVLGELEQEGLALKANVNLSPILLEQLSHSTFQEEFRDYLKQKVEAAQQDEREFTQQGEKHFAELARFWQRFYGERAQQFDALGGNLVAGFKHFYDSGAIEIITCGATHGYFPLLGTDASIRAQVRVGVETHQRYFGRQPRGIWLPECGYRPAGSWRYPVAVNGSAPANPFPREGVEQILAEAGIEYFVVDTHLVESTARFTPYELLAGDVPVAVETEGGVERASFYRPYFADSPQREQARVAFFTRDPRTGIQVWSGEHGYPGDPGYLEFHKKRWPGGHRYWQVTHPRVDLGLKTAYYPEAAHERTRIQAQHFSHVANSVLRYHAPQNQNGTPPILTAPFDAELFGHWWFEGPEWLKHVAEEFAHPGNPLALISCGEYLDKYPPAGYVALPEGSWGRNGQHEVWLNPETRFTWEQIYPAELAVQQMVAGGRWQGHEAATRLAKQICRELLLLESSDWQFLITTQHARDYAEKRFHTHLEQFRALMGAWRQFESTQQLSAEAMQKLAEIERRDDVFPEITPEVYAR
ncbi:MAG TPA: 1,4-alpha-glucan branching protein domain-containing protein [Terriglobales bacterium]|nr:1,4-alpha-glucan branching protein domain-containing protein [Terriglobales bacterium]